MFPPSWRIMKNITFLQKFEFNIVNYFSPLVENVIFIVNILTTLDNLFWKRKNNNVLFDSDLMNTTKGWVPRFDLISTHLEN